MMEDVKFHELSQNELMLIDGGVNWGEVAAGAGAIGATLAGIGVAAIATPVIVPLSAAGAAVGIGCFLVGAASGYLISHGLRH